MFINGLLFGLGIIAAILLVKYISLVFVIALFLCITGLIIALVLFFGNEVLYFAGAFIILFILSAIFERYGLEDKFQAFAKSKEIGNDKVLYIIMGIIFFIVIVGYIGLMGYFFITHPW